MTRSVAVNKDVVDTDVTNRRSIVSRVPDVSSTLPASPPELLAALGVALPGAGQVRSRATDRLALGHDASHFALTPSAIATPANAADVGLLFAVSG